MTKNSCVGPVASGTLQTQSIYVDKAATGAGTGVDWTNAFTTVQAAIDSLPAIINHAVTIYVRKGATPYRETVTIKRTVSAGSITLRGEYYWNNAVASAGSENGKFNLAADDTGIAAGDIVYLQRYTGTVNASTPDLALFDTVASVNGTEVTLTTNTGQAFTTSWYYVICRTEISGSDNGSTPTRNYCIRVGTNTECVISGLYFTLPNSSCIIKESDGTLTLSKCIMSVGTKNAIGIYGGAAHSLTYFGVTGGSGVGTPVTIECYGNTILAQFAICMSPGSAANTLILTDVPASRLSVYRGYIRTIGNTTGYGISCTWGARAYVSACNIDGYSATYKLAIALYATFGGFIFSDTMTFGSNITTQKSPTATTSTETSLVL